MQSRRGRVPGGCGAIPEERGAEFTSMQFLEPESGFHEGYTSYPPWDPLLLAV